MLRSRATLLCNMEQCHGRGGGFPNRRRLGWRTDLCLHERREPIGAVSLLFRYGENSGDSAHAELHWYLFPLPNFPASLLFSKIVVQRKDLKKMTPLAWAQEVPGSNPGAPTKIIFRSFFSLSKGSSPLTSPVEFSQAGGLVLQAIEFASLRCTLSRPKTLGAGVPFKNY